MARELTEQEKQDIMEMEPDFKLYGIMDLEKSSTGDDEEEKRLVFGEISNPGEDEQGESLIQKSLDFTYFDDKGVIKFEHYPKNSPSNIIGFPHERHTSDNNTVIKGALLKGHKMADETWSLIRAIEKHNEQFPENQKTLGWSVEGNYASRKRRGKFVKSAKIYNVVITANPVLKSTYLKMVEEKNAPILKSLAATPVSTDLAEKTGGDAIIDSSIDTNVKDKTGKKDKKKKKKSSKQNKEKFVMKSFKTHEEAVAHFVNQGLDEEQAEVMAKSLQIEQAPEAEKPDNSEELSVISKSINQIKDLVKSLKPEPEDELEDPDDDVIDEDIEEGVLKSLGDEEDNEVDVTEFLEGINRQNKAILKSVKSQEQVYDVFEKSIMGFCDIVESLNKEVKNIEKSLSVEGHPIGEAVHALMKSRSGFTTQGLQNFGIQKSDGNNTGKMSFSKLHSTLEKSVNENLITMHEQSRAENAFRLGDLDTMNEVLSKCKE